MLTHNKGKYRLVFSDIDGTLLNSRRQIGEKKPLSAKAV